MDIEVEEIKVETQSILIESQDEEGLVLQYEDRLVEVPVTRTKTIPAPDVVIPGDVVAFLKESLLPDEDFLEGEYADDQYMVNVETKTPYLGQPALDKGQLMTKIKIEHLRRETLGCSIQGIHITGDEKMQLNLRNLKELATFKKEQGKGEETTVFKDGSNVMHTIPWNLFPMLWMMSVEFGSELFNAKWRLQEMDVFPTDYTDDAYWPSFER